MIPTTALLVGTFIIVFSGLLGYVVGRASVNIEKGAKNGEYGVTRTCSNCRYGDLYEDEDPCDTCEEWSNWEPDQ